MYDHYDVISADTIDELKSSVNSHMVRGYEPIGGVCVSRLGEGGGNDGGVFNIAFYQAILKRNPITVEDNSMFERETLPAS